MAPKPEDAKIVKELDTALAAELEKKQEDAVAQKAADQVEKSFKITPPTATPIAPATPAPPPEPKRGDPNFVRKAGPDSAQE